MLNFYRLTCEQKDEKPTKGRKTNDSDKKYEKPTSVFEGGNPELNFVFISLQGQSESI